MSQGLPQTVRNPQLPQPGNLRDLGPVSGGAWGHQGGPGKTKGCGRGRDGCGRCKLPEGGQGGEAAQMQELKQRSKETRHRISDQDALLLWGEGKTDREIAEALGVDPDEE